MLCLAGGMSVNFVIDGPCNPFKTRDETAKPDGKDLVQAGESLDRAPSEQSREWQSTTSALV